MKFNTLLPLNLFINPDLAPVSAASVPASAISLATAVLLISSMAFKFFFSAPTDIPANVAI